MELISHLLTTLQSNPGGRVADLRERPSLGNDKIKYLLFKMFCLHAFPPVVCEHRNKA